MMCETCQFWKYSKTHELAGAIGTCRINPPIYDTGLGAWNNWPRTTSLAWCAKWEQKN